MPIANLNERLSQWLRIALINFFIAASAGALLRFAFVREIPWLKYSYFLHTHSHMAMLGWIFLLLYILLLRSFLPRTYQRKSFYRYFFWIFQITVIGMLISFPLQGYGPVSITFTILNVLVTYVFTFYFWYDLTKTSKENSNSVRLAKTALFFLGFSMLGVLAIGPVIAFHLDRTTSYYIAIHFYLHFQFNGWFIFSILALFFRMSEEKGASGSPVIFKRFYALIVAATFLTFALAVAWSNPGPVVFFSNSIGVILQLAALILFIALLTQLWVKLRRMIRMKLVSLLLKIAIAALILKILVQTAVVLPFVAEVAYTVRNYMIGFFHLLLLGVITIFGFAYAHLRGLLRLDTQIAHIGLFMFLFGFFMTEIILFLQGTLFWGGKGFLPYYYELLFIFSVFLPGGILVLIISQVKADQSRLHTPVLR